MISSIERPFGIMRSMIERAVPTTSSKRDVDPGKILAAARKRYPTEADVLGAVNEVYEKEGVDFAFRYAEHLQECTTCAGVVSLAASASKIIRKTKDPEIFEEITFFTLDPDRAVLAVEECMNPRKKNNRRFFLPNVSIF